MCVVVHLLACKVHFGLQFVLPVVRGGFDLTLFPFVTCARHLVEKLLLPFCAVLTVVKL